MWDVCESRAALQEMLEQRDVAAALEIADTARQFLSSELAGVAALRLHITHNE